MTDEKDLFKTSMDELFSLSRFGIKLGLETISAMLSAVGAPQKSFRAVHVAGTNGKGSVSATLSCILHRAGFSVGTYTSPHLVSVNERFCVDGRPVSDREIIEAYQALKKTPGLDRSPTFFEYTTAMAFFIFAKRRVDWAVVETGMGGRLDATNILKPEASVITNISLEHQFYLGNTIAAIASEKGGIIKKDTPVVSAASQKSAVSTLEKIAAKKNAPLFLYGRDFSTRKKHDGSFDYEGISQRMPGVKKVLAGAHQVANSACVLAACEVLREKGVSLPEKAVREGFLSVRWPGRLDEIPGPPRVLLDGAHNKDALDKLCAHLDRQIPPERLIVVAGFLEDKPYSYMLEALMRRSRALFLTRPSIDRAVDPKEIAKNLPPGSCLKLAESTDAALGSAMGEAKDGDVILVTGSLYMVGEALSALERRGMWNGLFRLWDD